MKSEKTPYLNIPVELLRNALDNPEEVLCNIYLYFFTTTNTMEEYMRTCEVYFFNRWVWIDGVPYDCEVLQTLGLPIEGDSEYKKAQEICNSCPIKELCIKQKEKDEKDEKKRCKKHLETNEEEWLTYDHCEQCEYNKQCNSEIDKLDEIKQSRLFAEYQRYSREKVCCVHFSGWTVGIAKETILPNLFDSEKSKWERACLLCYISLRSILGKQPMCVTNSRLMFARMAGYYSYSDIEFDELGSIRTYFNTERQMSKYSEDFRLDVMDMFKTFHIYAEKGKRGFVIAKSNKKRIDVFNAMKDFLHNSTKDSRRNAIKELMKTKSEET